MTAAVTVSLSAPEWELISALRDVPESPLKRRVETLVAELARFALEPKCAEAQADGDPCPSTRGDCESCVKIASLLEALRRRLVG